MFFRKLLVFGMFAGCGFVRAQETSPAPRLDGFVTRVGTAEDFDVNRVHVVCRVAGEGLAKDTLDSGKTCVARVYGEHLLIFGRLDKKSDTLHATAIQSPDHVMAQSISGFAVVDAVLATDLLRADGRAIQLVSSTHVEPASIGAAPQAGQWIRYTGKRIGNGVVQASSVQFFNPEVTASEQKLRNKNEFDPAAVSEDDRQSGVSKFFRGTDYKRIPAAHDGALQARVAAIGERLIPAAQKQLPEGDPNKLHFRFQIVESKWRDAGTLPNGIILVPERLASELNDDQLAAVLADNIATAVEKHAYRSIPATHAMTATQIAGDVGGILIPGLGLATGVGNAVASHNMEKHREEQRGRDSLVLMHDAGFDVEQAPVAWWRLSSSKSEFMHDKVPHRAAYLFETLATDWVPGSPLLQRSAAAPIAP